MLRDAITRILNKSATQGPLALLQIRDMRSIRLSSFEDVLMRALRDVNRGCYVEIDSGDPDADHSSIGFYERGWHGLHVEPTVSATNTLRETRPDADIIQAVLAPSVVHSSFDNTAKSASGAPFVMHESVMNKSVRANEGSDTSNDVVQSLTLAKVLDRLGPREIHWLKINASAIHSLEGWQPSLNAPWIVVVHQTSAVPSETIIQDWQSSLLSLGYEFARHDDRNWFFIRSDKSELQELLALDATAVDKQSVDQQTCVASLHDEPLFAKAAATIDLIRQSVDVSASAAALDAFRADVAAEISWLRHSAKRLDVVLERREADLRDQIKTIEALQSNIQQQNRDLKRKKEFLDELVQELDAMRSDLVVNKGLVENRTQYINLLHTSTSWRITAPLRKAVQLIAYVRRGLWSWASFKAGSRPHRVAARLGVVRGVHFEKTNTTSTKLLSWDQSVRAPRSGPPIAYFFVDHTIRCNVNTGIQRTVRGLATGLLDRNQSVRFVKWDSSLQAVVLIDASERDYLARWNGPAVCTEDNSIYSTSKRGSVVPVHPQPADWLIVPEATCITEQDRAVTLDLIRWAREANTHIGFIFYDAIPLRRLELAASVPAQKIYMRALQYADAVWSISAWSAADLIAFWSAENVVGHPPVYALPLPGALAAVRPLAEKPSENLILSVGTIEPRKNQVALVRAFQAHRLNDPNSKWKLVLVGNLHPLVAAEISAATKNDSAIRYAGHVADDELSSLFERCAFTVFPSVEEGFGLPILESLWYGKPCLCADFGSMAEVAVGGGCLTCDTRNDEALGEALNRLIAEPALRSELAQQARQRQMQNWSDYADSLLPTMWPLGQIYYLAQATAEWERNTGIQRVVRQLGRALLDLGLDVIPVKLAPNGTSLEPMTEVEIDRLAAFNGPARARWHGWLPPAQAVANSWFVMPELPLHLSPQNHESLIVNLRKADVKSAAIFYDAIPWKMNSIYPAAYGETHARYMTALATYDVVAPISRYTATDLINFLKASNVSLHQAQIKEVVLPGEFSESARVTTASSPSADGPIRILSVGTIEPRKNHEVFLQAFIQAAAKSKRPLHLTLVGSSVSIDPALPDRVRSFTSGHTSIAWEEHADDTRLKQLHETCDFTVYPSVEEGFGLPILESLWYGKPVICANFGSMGEIAPGGGCIVVDVRDTGALADAIRALADDPERISQLSDEAIKRPFRSWNDYAREFIVELGASKTSTVSEPAELIARQAELGLVIADRPQRGTFVKEPFYCLVESTSRYDQNTGIQRVVRQLTRLLIEKGFALIPVRWDGATQMLVRVSTEDLRNLAKFNGPKIEDWAAWRSVDEMRGGWFLLPEVQQHWRTVDHIRLIETMKQNQIHMAAIFYDAIPIKMPNLYPDWLVSAHHRYMIELGFYDLVLPISQFSARDLVRFLKERGFRDQQLDHLVKPFVLPGEFPGGRRVTSVQSVDMSKPFRLLTVATIEPRKNHKTLVLAFLLATKLCSRQLELMLIGNTNAVDPLLAGQIREMIAGHSNVRWLQKVDDEELVKWNDWSDVTVYPSLEEGFGLPILESLWHGKPVLCANFGAMAEAAEAGGCLTVDVRDTEAFANAICALADTPEMLTRLSQEAIMRPIKSWNDYAEEVAQLFLDEQYLTSKMSEKNDTLDSVGARSMPTDA